jgi:8-oxo-dGTP diphosphatase
MRFAPLALVPDGALLLLKEVARHVLRRPVVGIAIAAKTREGKWLLIRRADTGTWAMVGGTLEWGETMRACVARELEEEAGVVDVEITRVVGVYSRPDRDPRFHAVTVVVACEVGPFAKPPMNRLEVREVGIFADAEIPAPLAMGQSDMLAFAQSGLPAAFE